jgi:hypothetical protein
VKIGGSKFRPLVTLEKITTLGTHRYYDFGYWLNVKSRYLGSMSRRSCGNNRGLESG